ncbi:DUF3137 domain-containing protein [Myroides albus]|uniref:DUF3137 domain-containing protein n=1 Tax=Myroides albus TaxID=2562892 RepID=UPI0021599D6F|nr:DUF3137 domain-containing protein [Myroides albus]UVD79259.1 DUF3137 domain-containing protein [Myroides albus]
MNIEQVKHFFVSEARREKRIVLRNTIIIGSIICIGIAILLFFTRDFIVDYFVSSAVKKGDKEGIERYIPWIVIVSLLVVVYFSVRASLRREHTVDKVFKLLEKGEKAVVLSEERKSLTNLFLFVVTLKFDPIIYLSLELNGGVYTLPIQINVITDVKRFFEFGQQEDYDKLMDTMYGDPSDTQVAAEQMNEEFTSDVVLKPITEFRAYFSQNFGLEIKAMEQQRKASKRKILLVLGVLIVSALAYVAVYQLADRSFKDTYNTVFIFGVLLILIVVIRFLFAKKKTGQNTTAKATPPLDYTAFKEIMLTRLAHYIHPSYSYFEKGYIGLPEVLHAGIFQPKSYSIHGGDQFVGHYNGVPFQSCVLSLSYRPTLSRSKDPEEEVFQGTFFVAKFPKKFSANMLIVPNKSILNRFVENCIGNYLNTAGEVVILKDAEFQKAFTVYCDNQLAARSILTPSFMQKLRQLNLHNKGSLYCSINGNNIAIAANIGNKYKSTADLVGDIFNTTQLDQNFLDEIYEDLTKHLSVIDTLK